MKTCSKCGVLKPESEFYRREGGKLRNDCKVCTRARVSKSPSKVKVRLEVAQKRMERQPFDPVAYKAAWHQENRERMAQKGREWAEAHPEQMRAYRRSWQKRNLRQGQQTAARRLARKLGNDCRIITERDWRRLVARYNGLCAYCRVRPWEHQDHVIPLARGGRHAIGNVLPACASCNQSKTDQLVVEWQRRSVRAA